MKRIPYFLVFFLLTISCAEPIVDERPPNVIVILADDQGWGDLSFHGNTNLSTPNIDSIAIQGAVVENFFVQPVCSPTRAELLTGQYSARLGVYSTSAGGERMNLGVPTFADLFKKAGYATAAYGKWHSGTQPPYHPNSRGFDDFYGFCSGHWGNYHSPMLEHNGAIVQGKGFLVDDLFEHGMEFIAQKKNEPFLLYLPVNTPHSPMQVPDRFWSKFENKPLEMTYRIEEDEDQPFTRAALAMVENIDWNVGRLNAFLKKNNLDDKTIIVYMSDNGPNGWRWNGGLRGKKGSTDEGGVKSPFFIKWPKKIEAGTKSTQLMGSVDLLPTLAGLAKIQLPDAGGLDGSDFSGQLLNIHSNDLQKVVYNHWNGKTSIRTSSFRLDNENKLYDIINDSGQTLDVSDRLQGVKDSLISLKTNWQKKTNALVRHDEKRLFPIGDPNHGFAQLPARDGIAHGTIKRSNRWPNDSFYTNWTQESDSITWDVDILSDSRFEVVLYYTCKAENVGTEIELSLNGKKINKKIIDTHDPPLQGRDEDRYPRMESYVKQFKPIKLGEINAKKGEGHLSLKAPVIPGDASIDFRLLYLKRI